MCVQGPQRLTGRQRGQRTATDKATVGPRNQTTGAEIQTPRFGAPRIAVKGKPAPWPCQALFVHKKHKTPGKSPGVLRFWPETDQIVRL